MPYFPNIPNFNLQQPPQVQQSNSGYQPQFSNQSNMQLLNKEKYDSVIYQKANEIVQNVKYGVYGVLALIAIYILTKR